MIIDANRFAIANGDPGDWGRCSASRWRDRCRLDQRLLLLLLFHQTGLRGSQARGGQSGASHADWVNAGFTSFSDRDAAQGDKGRDMVDLTNSSKVSKSVARGVDDAETGLWMTTG